MVTREARVTTRWLWSVLLHNDDQRFGGIEEIASLRYCKHYGREWSAKTERPIPRLTWRHLAQSARLSGWSKHPPSISYFSSLESFSTQLYIKSAFESCSTIISSPDTKLLGLREVIVMRHDTINDKV